MCDYHSSSVTSLFKFEEAELRAWTMDTITYKSRLTPKNGTKKPMLFLASMGKTGLTHDIFFKFSVGPFEVVEAEGGRLVKEADFEAENFFYYKK